MPTLDEINGVAVRTPIRMNLDAYSQALNKIDQRDLQARQIKSQIDATLGALPVNVADEPWLQDYIANIDKQLSDAASFGNYSNALNLAMELAGKAANDPELKARIQANKDYETKRNEIIARADRGDISQLTKERWLATNNYEFDTTTNQLKLYEEPVSSVDYGKLFNQVNALALAKTTQNNMYSYLDADGNLLDNFKDAYATLNITTKRQQRSRQDLQNVFNAVRKNNKDAILSLTQDLYDLDWKVKQYDEKIENTADPIERQMLEKERDEIKKDIYKNGVRMSPAEYLEARSSAVLDNLVIDDSTTNKGMQIQKPVTTGGGQLTDDQLDLEFGIGSGTYPAGDRYDDTFSGGTVVVSGVYNLFGE